MDERAAGVGRGAGVLHAPGDEIIHHDLRVFFPRVVDAKFLAEEFQHRRSAAVVDGQAIAAALGRVVCDGNAAPGFFHFIEFAGNYGNQVSGARDRFFPIPGLEAFAGVVDIDELAIRNGDPRGGDGEDRFGGQAVIWIVVRREVVTRVFGFALRPNLLGAVRIIFVRQNEVETFGGFAFVMDGDLEFISGFRWSGKRNVELAPRGFEFRGRFVDRDALDGQARGVERDFRRAVAKNGKRVRDVAKNFFLFDIEAQGNLGMLQIVVAAAREGFVGAELQSDDENRRQRGERDISQTTAAEDGARGFTDHSAALL